MRRLINTLGRFALLAVMRHRDNGARLTADDLELAVAIGMAHHLLLTNNLAALRTRPDGALLHFETHQ